MGRHVGPWLPNEHYRSLSPNVLSPADALANVMSERKHRTKLGLSKYAAEAAERAAESEGELSLLRKVRDVVFIGSTLWPENPNDRGILDLDLLTHKVNVYDAKTGVCIDGQIRGSSER